MHVVQTERGATLINSAPNKNSVKVLVRVALATIVIDSGTKSFALRTLNRNPKRIIGTILQLQLTGNSGAAFSLAKGATVLLSMLSLLAIVGIYTFSRSVTSRPWGFALGLLLGGVSGNLIDRFFRPPYFLRGEVVDWIRVPHWPVFNLADTSIVISAITIAILLINDVKPRSKHDVP